MSTNPARLLDHHANRPSLDANPPCFVCLGPVLDGDEPGWTFMDDGDGPAVPNCSVACAAAFYGVDPVTGEALSEDEVEDAWAALVEARKSASRG